MQKTPNAMKYLPVILGIASLVLFAAFVASLYSELVLKTWPNGIQYYSIISNVLPYFEAATLLFVLSIAFVKPSRFKMILAIAGTALVLVSLYNTTIYAGLGLTTFSDWYHALFLRIVVPFGLGVFVAAAMPALEIILGGTLRNRVRQTDSVEGILEEIEGKIAALSVKSEYDFKGEISTIGSQLRQIKSKVSGSKSDTGISVYIPEPTPGLSVGGNAPVPATALAADPSAASSAPAGTASDTATSASAAAEGKAAAELGGKPTGESEPTAPAKPAKKSSAKAAKPKVIAKKIATGAKKETKKLVTKVKKETEAVKTKVPKAKPKVIAKKIATGAKKETNKLVTKVKKETDLVKTKPKPTKIIPHKKVL